MNKKIPFEEYIKKYDLYQTLLIVKNFKIDIHSKEVDSMIQKELVNMYSPKYRQVNRPKQYLKNLFNQAYYFKGCSLLFSGGMPVEVKNINYIISKLGFDSEINIVVSDNRSSNLIILNDSEELCSLCKGSGMICKSYTNNSSVWNTCDLCHSNKKINWIDKIKRNCEFPKWKITINHHVNGESITSEYISYKKF